MSEQCYLFYIHAYVIRAFSSPSHRVILIPACLQGLRGPSLNRLLMTSEALKPLAANCALEMVAPCRLQRLLSLRGRSVRLVQESLNRLFWPCFACILVSGSFLCGA